MHHPFLSFSPQDGYPKHIWRVSENPFYLQRRVKTAAESSGKSFYNLVIDKLPSTYVLCHARSIQLEGYWLLSSKGLPSRCSTVHLKPHLYKGGLTCMGGDQQATHRTLCKLLIFIHPPPPRRIVSFFNAICNPFASLIATQQHLLWEKKSFEIDSVCEPRQPSVKNNS